MVFPWQNDEYFVLGGGEPTRNVLIGYGYDPNAYIATAGLTFQPYTTQALISAKIGGLKKLSQACDDLGVNPGALVNDALTVFNAVIQNVTNEINGFLAPIYPIPLQQTGTVSILKVTGITADGLGTVTSLEVVDDGNYASAPAAAQTPVYLRHLPDDDDICRPFWPIWNCQKGSGLALTVAYNQTAVLEGGGATINAYSVAGTPTITNGGTNYNCGDVLVLTGGSSFVPAKIQEAMLVLCCHDFYQRRLAPDEKNLFHTQCKMWRGDGQTTGLLQKVSEGEADLDGTFKRSFSAGFSVNRTSCLQCDTK